MHVKLDELLHNIVKDYFLLQDVLGNEADITTYKVYSIEISQIELARVDRRKLHFSFLLGGHGRTDLYSAVHQQTSPLPARPAQSVL